MEDGAILNCSPLESAVKFATAASSKSTTLKYFFDTSWIIRNFAE